MIPDLAWNEIVLLVIGLLALVFLIVVAVSLLGGMLAWRRYRQFERHLDAQRQSMLGRRR